MAHAQVLERGLVGVALLVERDGHLVDDALVLRLLDVAADGARLGALHVVLGQDTAHALHAGFNLPLVVGGAVLPQEELQHVARHGGVALHELHQVLAHHVSREYVVEFLVQIVHETVLPAHHENGAQIKLSKLQAAHQAFFKSATVLSPRMKMARK